MRFLLFIPLLFLFLLAPILAFATDIVLTWDTPTHREDGAQIEQIDHFNLYTSINNTAQPVTQLDGASTTYQLDDAEPGNYTFNISTVEFGQEGSQSDPVSININEKIISKIGKVKITIEAAE